jgi:hypothetical protein
VLFTGIMLSIVLLGVLMMVWQRRAWEAKLIRDHHNAAERPFIDHPKMPRNLQLRNLALLMSGSVLLGWLFQGRFELSFWQWFLLLSGFMLFYMDHRLLGVTTVYILTDQGLGIRFAPGHIDYRLFISYREIKHARRIPVPKDKPPVWSQITPQRSLEEGILLTPTNLDGFSKLLPGEILLAPTDMDAFLKQLSGHVHILKEPEVL